MRWTWLVLGLLTLGYALTGVYQIYPGERAVVRRFGRVLEEKPVPGLWLSLPWGMDRVDRVPVHLVRRLEIGAASLADERRGQKAERTPQPGQLVTGDQNLVNARVAVDYTVAPAEEAIVEFVLHQDRLEGMLSRATEAALAEWVAGRRIDDLLTRGKAELPEPLAHEVQRRIAPFELGVLVRGVVVLELLPPDEVRGAFEDVTRAHTEVRTREQDALQAAARRAAGAHADRYAAEQQAQADAASIRLQARAEAAAFARRLAEYRRLKQENADALTALWWDHMSRLFRTMREGGRLDLLDHRLGGDGLDITVAPALPKKK